MTDENEVKPEDCPDNMIDLLDLDKSQLKDLVKKLVKLQGFCPSCLCKKDKK